MKTLAISALLDWAANHLKKYDIDFPRLEVEILLAFALNLKKVKLHSNPERILTEKEVEHFKNLIHRRSKREPIAYITGTQPFMSMDFYVDRSVLIPRPETEKLVEVTVDLIKLSTVPCSPREKSRGPLFTVADIGTGSGIIAISLAKYLSNVNVFGIDSSPDAIKIARKNAEFHKVSNRCRFEIGNLFEPLNVAAVFLSRAISRDRPPLKFDLIVSNPPYIPSKKIDKLQPDVKDWEPRYALDGGEDGLDYIRKLIMESPKHLKPKGLLLIEIGFDQGKRVKELVKKTKKYSEVELIKDINGKNRILKTCL